MMTKPGDRVLYDAFGGELRIVTVVESSEDIKDGRPGFDGDMDDGTTVWGYDSQILAINNERPVNGR